MRTKSASTANLPQHRKPPNFGDLRRRLSVRIGGVFTIAFVTAVPAQLWSQQEQSAEPLSALSEADIAEGAILYQAHCSVCHGVDGSGGKGPNLRRPNYHRAGDDEALLRVIRQGIREAGMPRGWMMNSLELRRVGGYLRSIGRKAAAPLPGDSERGRAVYEKQGCPSCHIIRGEGGSLGPELSEVGLRRGAPHLRESILNPGADQPENNPFVEVVSANGAEIRGLLVNEDVFSIQIRDASNRFHSLEKRQLRDLRRPKDQSLMPRYDLAGAELDDLVAYLAALRGEQ